jgi:glycerol-3-phosphate acyltransferase PlsY
MQALLWILIGFCFGSLPFSFWIGKLVMDTDIRTLGDGNPGGFNVWKTGNKFWAIVAIFLDAIKGAIPVGLVNYNKSIIGWALIPVALAPLIGHIFSPLLRFRGGKGLATTFGIWLGLTYWMGPTVFGLSLFFWRKVFKSDRAVLSAGLMTLLVVLLLTGRGPTLAIICIGNLALVWWAYGKKDGRIMNKKFAQFENQDYLNLQTLRQNGQNVNTPVWFILKGEIIYIRTIATSSKVKRIHNNNQVKIMPCGSRGEPLGSWVDALARELPDENSYAKMSVWLAGKYGDQPANFEAQAKARGEKYTVIEITMERYK